MSPVARALVIGEALTDVVRRGARVEEHPGGGPMNVAVGLARLGIATTLHTSLGDDARGRAIARHVRASGAALTEGSVRPGATAQAIATIDAAGGARYRFSIDGGLGPIPAADGLDAVHTGSIAAALAPGADRIEEFLRLAREGREGVRRPLVSLDPNVRPAVTPDRRAVARRIDGLAALADVVKLSEDDAAWLWPGESPGGVLARLTEAGVRVAVVTLGPRGCIARAGAAQVALPAPPAHVVDTIGAGDAFMAGLLGAVLARGAAPAVRRGDVSRDLLHRICDVASRCSGYDVQRAGANPPTAGEVGL